MVSYVLLLLFYRSTTNIFQSVCHAYIHTSATRFLALAQWQRIHTAAISERLPINAWSATTTQFRPTTTILSPNRNWLLHSSALTSRSLPSHDVSYTCARELQPVHTTIFLTLALFSYCLGNHELCIWALVIFGVFAYGVERTACVDETSWSNTRKGVEF